MIKIIDILPPGSRKEEEYFIPEADEEKPEKEPEIEKEEEIEDEIVEKEEKERVFPADIFASKIPKKINTKKILIIGGIACFIILGFIFYFTLAKAEVILYPKTETMEFQTTLIIDKNAAFVDLDGNKIPGQLFQVEKEKEREFPATQEKELKEKARGIINFGKNHSFCF